MKKLKAAAKEDLLAFDPNRFGWFEGQSGMGDSSMTKLGLPVKGRTAPFEFIVNFPDGPKKFTHQYSVTADSDDYSSKYLAVYWSGTQIVHVHFC